jgi:hypothetical protein
LNDGIDRYQSIANTIVQLVSHLVVVMRSRHYERDPGGSARDIALVRRMHALTALFRAASSFFAATASGV